MRYVRIFFLYFQSVLEYKSVSFVWFLIPLFNSVFLILFWKGVLRNGTISNWNFSSIATYYLLLLIASSLLMSNIEDDISRMDIRMGGLVKYLVKPFSYYWIKFYQEIPWRLLQGIYAILILIMFSFILKVNFLSSSSLDILLLSIVIAILAHFLAFTFKMIVGILAFWITDIQGLYQMIEIAILIFGGYLMPLDLLPQSISKLAYSLPFSYMIYYPIISFQGKLSNFNLINIIKFQIIWLFALFFVYKIVWKRGIRKFSGIGQ